MNTNENNVHANKTFPSNRNNSTDSNNNEMHNQRNAKTKEHDSHTFYS